MIENELLFLGLLVDRPKHGYEIKRQIHDDLKQSAGLKIKSIYYPLMKMEKDGLVAKETGRQGRFPEKYVYRITDKGRKKFDLLMQESFSSVERPFFQIDLSLYFIHLTNKPIAKRRLKARIAFLKKIAREVSVLRDRAQQDSAQSFLIHQHSLELIHAEIRSTTDLIERL